MCISPLLTGSRSLQRRPGKRSHTEISSGKLRQHLPRKERIHLKLLVQKLSEPITSAVGGPGGPWEREEGSGRLDGPLFLETRAVPSDRYLQKSLGRCNYHFSLRSSSVFCLRLLYFTLLFLTSIFFIYTFLIVTIPTFIFPSRFTPGSLENHVCISAAVTLKSPLLCANRLQRQPEGCF